MNNSTISALTELSTGGTGDLFVVVDVSDTTDAVTGTTKKFTINNLDTYLSATTKTLTNKTLTSPVLSSPSVSNGTRLSFNTAIEEKIRLYDAGSSAGSYGLGTTGSCTQIFSGFTGDIAISRGGVSGTQIARWVGSTDFMALGTITPVAKLHLDSGNATASAIKLTAGTTTGTTATDGINFGITTAGVGEIRQYENQVLNIYTNNTLAATFTTGQDLQVVSAGTTSTSVVTNAATQTLTNKRITPRVTSISSNSATPTINTDNCDFVSLTGQTNNITSMTTNLSGTPTNGQRLWIAMTASSGTPTVTWGSSFEDSTETAPTALSTTRQDVGFVWNTATSKWRCVAKR